MPVLRGTAHALLAKGTSISALVVMTNDRWNATMSQVGVCLVRRRLHDVEGQYAVELPEGHASAARLVSLLVPPHPDSVIGPAVRALSAHELAALEDRLCAFLQLPALVGSPAPRIPGPVGAASAYPVWSEIYRGPQAGAERKRFVIVSPNPWNAVSGVATAIRTTTSFKVDDAEFPEIQGGRARACCGDATTLGVDEFLLARRDRPTPFLTTMHDMIAIARGLVGTHELSAALRRLSP